VSLAQVLANFKGSVAQCESLIANAHRVDAAGAPLFPVIDQQQITVAAFLNMFIAWETFLESSLGELMIGSPTISGAVPVKYVAPLDLVSARQLVIGMMKYFDYGNHFNVKRLVGMYFRGGYPFEPHISAIYSDLDDLRTMRNVSAHISSTTQTAMEGLALRLFSAPKPGISLYQLLTAGDPKSPGRTVFVSYKTKLLTTAELITQG
jgi:hypothetical protein